MEEPLPCSVAAVGRQIARATAYLRGCCLLLHSRCSIAVKPAAWSLRRPCLTPALPHLQHPQQVGAVFEVSFKDVRASGENGIFLAGGPMASAEGCGRGRCDLNE